MRLFLVSFAMLIVSLDQYIVVVALPDIGRALGCTAQTPQSVISAYANVGSCAGGLPQARVRPAAEAPAAGSAPITCGPAAGMTSADAEA